MRRWWKVAFFSVGAFLASTALLLAASRPTASPLDLCAHPRGGRGPVECQAGAVQRVEAGRAPSAGRVALGARANSSCRCPLRQYGVSGRWVPSESRLEHGWVLESFPDTGKRTDWQPPGAQPTQYEWLDDRCGAIPEFSARRFCREAIDCSSVLVVGDSTSAQVFEVLVTSLGHNECAPFRNQLGSRRCGPQREINCDVCQKHCPKPSRITFLRHDHLDGPDFTYDPEVKNSNLCNHWRTVLTEYEFVVLGAGSHVNDHADYNSNAGHNWEAGMSALLRFIQERHPKNVVWRTAWYGIGQVTRFPCPSVDHMLPKPRERHQISDNFRDSWKHISDFNSVFRNLSAVEWPGGLVMLDLEFMMGMRGDCRTDNLHFHLGVGSAAAALWFLPRMLQHHLLAAKADPACLW